MSSKRFIIVIVSTLLFAAGVKLVLACADEGSPYDDYVSFFQNNITAQPQYKPFYYTSSEAFYGEHDYYGDIPEDDTQPDGNIEEWYSYCKKTATRADIDSFMNKFSLSQVQSLTGNNPQLTKENSFCKFLIQKNNREFLDYLLFAKKCEPLNVPVESYWDDASHNYKTTVKDTSMLWPLVTKAVSMNAVTKNDFLKWRYAYQALRLVFNNEHYQKTLELYEKLIGSKTAKNVMYPRCLGLKAGALFHTGKYKQAAYLYSRVFDISNDMKPTAYISYSWATDSLKISQLLSLCKNNHEKAVITVMDGLYEKSNEEYEGLKLIQKAYALDPNIKGLDIIMTREINKAEQRYFQRREFVSRDWTRDEDIYAPGTRGWDNQYYENEKKEWQKTKTKYDSYLDNLNLWAQKMASATSNNDKAFWWLASSYIFFIQDKFTDCRTSLNLAEKEKMKPHEHDVHDVINMLCILYKSETITPETEAELLPSLKWIETREHKSVRFQKVYRDFLSVILPDKYMAQKDTTRAVYCLVRAYKNKDGFSVADDFVDIPGELLENMSIDRMHELQKFVEKNDKTDFEKWLTYNTPYPAGVLREFEGTKYIREMQFGKAVAVLSKVPKNILSETTLPDVLISHLQETRTWNASDSANTYNKLKFAKKMLALEKTLDDEPNNGHAAYQYANGLYSMSYYGRAYSSYTYYHTCDDENAYYYDSSRDDLKPYEKEYYGLAKALKYYMIAYNNSKDREMKARCLFLAAKCWQKNCPHTGVENHEDDNAYYLNSLKNPYFARLYKEYKNTEFYNSASGSCSYFRDYLSKR